jgi:hypothetical protein
VESKNNNVNKRKQENTFAALGVGTSFSSKIQKAKHKANNY